MFIEKRSWQSSVGSLQKKVKASGYFGMSVAVVLIAN